MRNHAAIAASTVTGGGILPRVSQDTSPGRITLAAAPVAGNSEGKSNINNMAYYNYKELRDSLPPEMVEKWANEDGSADYDSTLWCYAAAYIEHLKNQLADSRQEAENWRNNIAAPNDEKLLFSWEIL
jgi:hypothetical protein